MDWKNRTRPSISTSAEGILIADGAGVVLPSSCAQRSIEILAHAIIPSTFSLVKRVPACLHPSSTHVRNLLHEFENSLTIFSTTCGCHVDDLLDDSSCAPVERCEQIPLSLRRSEKRVRPRSVVHCVSSTSVSWIILTRRDV